MAGLEVPRTPVADVLLGRSCSLDLSRPRIMGILNVTPDSFSDGALYQTIDTALARARAMAAEGADLVDVGGESTRPGATPASEQEELDRVIPVVERLVAELDLPLSIDTTKSGVARAALAAGAEFINDISGLSFDGAMAATVAELSAGLFLMHTRGRPDEMQRRTDYDDVVREVAVALQNSLSLAKQAGIAAVKLAVDPGIGFGKDTHGNLELLRRLPIFAELGRPVLLGTSRKRFIGQVLDQRDPTERLYGSLATVALGVAGGARIFRVHDVAVTREVVQMAWAVCQGQDWLPD